MSRISIESIEAVLCEALRRDEVFSPQDPAVIFYDLDAIKSRADAIRDAFPETAVHTAAIKANPLRRILEWCSEAGMGLEAASLPELVLAQRCGVDPAKIVFDSPAKTRSELAHALEAGVHINADSLSELRRLHELVPQYPARGRIGLRVNPQVGTGTIESTSVAGTYSKFGVPLRDDESAILDAYRRYDWLDAIHVHIGSQGCSLEMLTEGARRVMDLVLRINQEFEARGAGRRIDTIDIGGGLPVQYRSDAPTAPTVAQYAAALRHRTPELFSPNTRLITEFGRYVHANSGWVASRVENIKESPGLVTAVIHVGADLLLRRCYNPQDWTHEVAVFDPSGRRKTAEDRRPHMIVGPLCFAGDIPAGPVLLPALSEGDIVVLRDTGAYTLSMWSRYNSRRTPKVVGYDGSPSRYRTLKERESIDAVLDFWQ